MEASWIMSLCAGLSACALGCGEAGAVRAADVTPNPSVRVELADVTRGALPRTLHAAGTLHLKAEADLSFKIPGVVTRVAADSGSRVKKGQLLAALDPAAEQALLRQAAESLEKAQRDVVRVRQLLATGAAASADAQNAETAVAVARATADAAEFNLRHTTLLAPDDGVIDRRTVEVGEIVAPGRPLFHMSGLSRGAIVRVQLADRQVLQLARGNSARVRIDAQPDRLIAAHVSQIASAAAVGGGTFEVELQLDDPTRELPSGLVAKVEIDCVTEPTTNIPIGALVDGDGASAAVYVVEAGHAKRVPVRVSYLRGDQVALASGLERESRVIALGAALLSDGAPVQISP